MYIQPKDVLTNDIGTKSTIVNKLHYTQSLKAKPIAAVRNTVIAAEPTMGCLCTTQVFEANPPGAGIITSRRTVIQPGRLEQCE